MVLFKQDRNFQEKIQEASIISTQVSAKVIEQTGKQIFDTRGSLKWPDFLN